MFIKLFHFGKNQAMPYNHCIAFGDAKFAKICEIIKFVTFFLRSLEH